MRSRIAFVYSLTFCYCIVVGSANADQFNNAHLDEQEFGNSSDPNKQLLQRLLIMGEEQIKRLDSLENWTKNVEEFNRKQDENINKMEHVTAEFDQLKKDFQQLRNNISLIINGISCDKQPRCQFERETKNKLEMLELSVQNVSSSIGCFHEELSSIKRDITNVANVTSESLELNKQFPTTEYLDTTTKELKNTTMSEMFKMTERWAQYEETLPANCWDLLQNGYKSSGIYTIRPWGTDHSYNVYCNMETHGGGWTVFQNRKFNNNRGGNFNRKWQEYKLGFGDLHGDFWLGLENVHQMTSHEQYEVLIEVKALNSTLFFAQYDHFTIGSEVKGYPIEELGDYTGTAGNCLLSNVREKFSTIDMDNDKWKLGNCASMYEVGWWYGFCSHCILNGRFTDREVSNTAIEKFVHWKGDHGDEYPLMETRMSLRPQKDSINLQFTQPRPN